jgi:signal transduction histidine kinase
MSNDDNDDDSRSELQSTPTLATSLTTATPLAQAELVLLLDHKRGLTICPAGELLFGHSTARRLGHALAYALWEAARSQDCASIALVAETDEQGNVGVVCHHGATSRPRTTGELDVIVHDLRGPIATVLLEVALLDDPGEIEQDRVRRAAQRIRKNVEYVSLMIDDMFELGALDRGELVLHCKTTELRALLQDVIERAVATRDHERVTFVAPTPVVLSLDDKRIERVVANLLQNALKYSPRDSPIVVKLECGGEHARVSIADVGPGIADCDECAIFEKYRRGRDSSAVTGSGIGLYISKQIVEAHGGRIGVESNQGHGACFYFDLPRL